MDLCMCSCEYCKIYLQDVPGANVDEFESQVRKNTRMLLAQSQVASIYLWAAHYIVLAHVLDLRGTD